ARTQGRDDLVIADAGRERVERDLEPLGVNSQARKGSAGLEYPQAVLESLLLPERLDRDVDAAAAGGLHDRLYGVSALEVDRLVGAKFLGVGQTVFDRVDREDFRCAHQSGAGHRAKPDRALGEDGDRVDDADPA